MRKIYLVSWLALMLVFVFSVGAFAATNGYKLGWSQVVVNNPYYEAMRITAEKTAKELGCEMIFLDAQNDPAKQVADIENLIAQGINGLFINPITPFALTSAVKDAVNAGIPIISVDRELYGDYVSYVGIDQWKAGELQGEFIGQYLNGQGNIVEIAGDPGDSAGMGRGGGLRKIFYEKYPGIKILQTYIAHYNQLEGKQVMQDAIVAFGDEIDLVYAHNDAMALGALAAIQEAGLHIPVAGVDGQKQAYEEIMKPGSLYLSTVVNNSAEITEVAVNLMVKYLNGEEIPKKVVTGTVLVTKDNVEEYYNPDSIF